MTEPRPDRSWLRLLVQMLANTLVGLSAGLSAQSLFAGRVPGWVGALATVAGVLLLGLSWRLTNQYVAMIKADTAWRDDQREQIALARQELADIIARFSVTENKHLVANRENGFVGEVDPDGNMIPVRDPGLAALVMNQVANRLRWEALQRAAQEDKGEH